MYIPIHNYGSRYTVCFYNKVHRCIRETRWSIFRKYNPIVVSAEGGKGGDVRTEGEARRGAPLPSQYNSRIARLSRTNQSSIHYLPPSVHCPTLWQYDCTTIACNSIATVWVHRGQGRDGRAQREARRGAAQHRHSGAILNSGWNVVGCKIP